MDEQQNTAELGSTELPALAPTEGAGGPVWTAAETIEGPIAPAPDAQATFTGTTVTGSRRRWAIAGLVSVVVVSLAVAGGIFLAGSSEPAALAYVPGDSVLVAEIRMDLPGDQRAKLGTFLAHFPGFADQAILDDKIDEALSRLVAEGSRNSIDYRTRIKPFLDGPTYLAVADLAGMVSSGATDGPAAMPTWIVVLTSDGTVGCTDLELPDARSESRGGHDLLVSGSGDAVVGCLVDGRVVVLGSLDGIDAALDAKAAGTGFAHAAAYRESTASLHPSRLGAAWIDGAAYMTAIAGMSGMESLSGLLDSVPMASWMAVELLAHEDALDLAMVAPIPSDAPDAGATPRTSAFASIVPGDTVVLFEAHDLGSSLATSLDLVRKADPASAEQIDQALAMAGGYDNLLGWIEDLAVVGTYDATTPSGGVLIRATDAAAAASRVAQIRNLLVLAGAGSGGGISVRTEMHGDTEIVVADLGDISSLLGGLGMPGSPLPGDPGAGSGDRVEMAMAVRDDLVLVGAQSFVEAILDLDPGASLAESAAFKRVSELIGVKTTGLMYVDVDAIIGAVGNLAGEAPGWSDAEPYLAPLGALGVGSTIEGGRTVAHIVLTVH